MQLSVMLTSLPHDFAPALDVVARLGFSHVDLVALADRPPEQREILAATDLIVSCVALGRGLPDGCTLDAPSQAARLTALDMMKRQVIDAAQLGATHAYLVPGLDGSREALARFTEGCALLAGYAESRMVQLCVEHFPGRALPTAQATLQWLERRRLDNVGLLLDVGHCLISDEEPARAVLAAGDRLGYVHWDDNDSVGDLHWPLLTGRLTQDMIDATVAALREVGYAGGMALELNPGNANPVGALSDGKQILRRALGTG